MKIIKQIDPTSWAHSFTCPKCKSELEANVDDLVYHSSESDGPYSSGEYYTVACPVCHNDYSLTSKGVQVPEVVLLKAKSKYRRVSYNYWDK